MTLAERVEAMTLAQRLIDDLDRRYNEPVDAALILADQILTLIRNAGVSKMEAHSALSVASSVLPSITDVPFQAPDPEPSPKS